MTGFKENAKIFSKNFTAQGNTTISRQNLLLFFFLIKNTKSSHPSASDWWGNNKSSFKENARIFLKNSTTHENIKILRLKEECKTYRKKKTSNQNYIND